MRRSTHRFPTQPSRRPDVLVVAVDSEENNGCTNTCCQYHEQDNDSHVAGEPVCFAHSSSHCRIVVWEIRHCSSKQGHLNYGHWVTASPLPLRFIINLRLPWRNDFHTADSAYAPRGSKRWACLYGFPRAHFQSFDVQRRPAPSLTLCCVSGLPQVLNVTTHSLWLWTWY